MPMNKVDFSLRGRYELELSVWNTYFVGIFWIFGLPYQTIFGLYHLTIFEWIAME